MSQQSCGCWQAVEVLNNKQTNCCLSDTLTCRRWAQVSVMIFDELTFLFELITHLTLQWGQVDDCQLESVHHGHVHKLNIFAALVWVGYVHFVYIIDRWLCILQLTGEFLSHSPSEQLATATWLSSRLEPSPPTISKQSRLPQHIKVLKGLTIDS